jgi:hypothetical protein
MNANCLTGLNQTDGFVEVVEYVVESVLTCVSVPAQVGYVAQFALSGFSELTRNSLELWCRARDCQIVIRL